MTKSESAPAAPWHLWVVGGLLLLMNAPAVVGYVASVIRFEPYLSALPEETRAYYDNAPIWMDIVWGVSIIGGLTGAILLLMRRSLAVPVTAAAWLGSVAAVMYALQNPAPDGGSPLFMAAILMIALLILVYMRWLQKQRVLR